MPSIELTDTEWGQVMNILSTASWRDANPLLMKIGEQLRHQVQTRTPTPDEIRIGGNSQEVHNG